MARPHRVESMPMGDAHVELAHEPEFALGGLVVRPATRAVVRPRDGAEERLEPRVMQVLVALARSTGGTVSRDDLTHCCWDGRIVGEDAINRVMARLRRLASGIGEGAFRVETITKVGHRLILASPQGMVAPAARDSDPPAASPSRARQVRWLVLAAGAMLASAGGVALHRGEVAPAPPLAHVAPVAAAGPGPTAAAEYLPGDPATAALYLKARENWALRNARGIGEAISGFGAVISRDPSYAPAYAGLADAYILAREFGSLDDDVAFPKARAASLVALRIDPNLAAAQRALGFVHYWWGHDPVAAGKSFRRALALAPGEGQTHFWYGNILADNGDFASALRELDAARAINPESIAIQTDWAWARWSAGDRDGAVRMLIAIERSHPDLATPHDCLRTIYLAERDYRRYLAESAILVRLRAVPDFEQRATAERDAFARGGTDALQRLLLEHALDARGRPVQDLAWPAFVASSIGDRAALMTVLRKADARHEIWGSAGQTAHIMSAWHDDPEVTALLARRKAPPIE